MFHSAVSVNSYSLLCIHLPCFMLHLLSKAASTLHVYSVKMQHCGILWGFPFFQFTWVKKKILLHIFYRNICSWMKKSENQMNKKIPICGSSNCSWGPMRVIPSWKRKNMTANSKSTLTKTKQLLCTPNLSWWCLKHKQRLTQWIIHSDLRITVLSIADRKKIICLL